MPRRADGGRTRPQRPARERILDAALAEFAARGFAATPTKAIARRAGVAEALVFYHFANKQQLLDRLVAERSFAAALQAALEAAAGRPDANLYAVAQRVYELLADRRALLRVLIQTTGADPAPLPQLQELLSRELAVLADHVTTTVGVDRIGPDHSSAIARALLSTLVVAVALAPPELDARTFVHDTVAVLLRGYAPEEGPGQQALRGTAGR